MRVLTMVEQTYFYIANKPTLLSELDKDLDPMILKLEAAQSQASIAEAGLSLSAIIRLTRKAV